MEDEAPTEPSLRKLAARRIDAVLTLLATPLLTSLSTSPFETKTPERKGVGGLWATHQSQNSIFTLEVDGDIRLDEVAGQHGDANSKVRC